MKTSPDTTDDAVRVVPPRRAKHAPAPPAGRDRLADRPAERPADRPAERPAGRADRGGEAGPPRPGRVWALPGGPGCAGFARRAVAEALGALGVDAEAASDARLMVSELATNAFQHAAAHGPHELWLDVAGPAEDGGAEVRIAVFDAYAEAGLPGYSWTSGDCGRGLSIVRELSRGRWGMLRAASRVERHVPGKAVWFAVPADGPQSPAAPDAAPTPDALDATVAPAAAHAPAAPSTPGAPSAAGAAEAAGVSDGSAGPSPSAA